jgi:predicted phosphoribosyltransferase
MFASREDAGRRLADYLRWEEVRTDLVLGLPRGGVVVAAEVARVLQVPLDVVVVRKIGHPWQREFAVGALAEGGVVVLDKQTILNNLLLRGELDRIIEEERERLQSYQARFHPEGGINAMGKDVLLVDDGLATGATTEAAVLSMKKQQARRVIVAAPVGSTNAVQRLQKVADDVRVLWVDPEFDAVGRYYDSFSQTTDEEVLGLLRSEVNR